MTPYFSLIIFKLIIVSLFSAVLDKEKIFVTWLHSTELKKKILSKEKKKAKANLTFA